MNDDLRYVLSHFTFDVIILWIILAFLCFVIGYAFHRRGKMRFKSCLALSILIFYLASVYMLTISARIVTPEATLKAELFWSYKQIAAGNKSILLEVILNVVLFVPYGLIASIMARSKIKWTVFLTGFLLTVGIELTQLLTHRGLFEFDDIIHNTLGTIIGIGIYYIFANIFIVIERKIAASKRTKTIPPLT